MLTLSKYSLGVGDRFAHQAKAQLRACMTGRRTRRRGRARLEQVAPRTHHHRLRARQRPHGRRRRGARTRLEKALPRGRRPHPPGNRGRLPRLQRLLHHRRGRRHRPARRGGRGQGLRRPPSRSRRPSANPRHRGAVPDDAGRRGADRRQIPARRAGGGADLPTYCRGQGRRDVHHRSVDGRDRQPADAARTAGHPGRRSPTRRSPSRRSRRSSPAVSTRASITSATWRGSRRNSTTTSP